MALYKRRSLLQGSLGFAAAGALARPYIANAQAKTVTLWFAQGFVEDEDVALRKAVADYEKASGNKAELSIIPFAPMRQKIVSAIASGVVPDVTICARHRALPPRDARSRSSTAPRRRSSS